MRLIGGTLVLAALLVVTGCSNDKSPAQPADASDSASVASSSSSPSAKATPHEVAARPYFAALAKLDTVAMTRAARHTAAGGSLAQAYMTHQANGINAQLDGGEDVSAGKLLEHGSGYRVCYPDEKGHPCYNYDHFKVTSDGRLASFAINNRPLRGRIVLGSGQPVDASTATITVLSAYQTATGGYLTVAVKVRSHGTGIVFFDPAATYRAPNGQQRAVNGESGLTEFAAHSQGTELFYFKGPLKFGGTITLQTATHSGGNNYGNAVNITAKVG